MIVILQHGTAAQKRPKCELVWRLLGTKLDSSMYWNKLLACDIKRSGPSANGFITHYKSFRRAIEIIGNLLAVPLTTGYGPLSDSEGISCRVSLFSSCDSPWSRWKHSRVRALCFTVVCDLGPNRDFKIMIVRVDAGEILHLTPSWSHVSHWMKLFMCPKPCKPGKWTTRSSQITYRNCCRWHYFWQYTRIFKDCTQGFSLWIRLCERYMWS